MGKLKKICKIEEEILFIIKNIAPNLKFYKKPDQVFLHNLLYPFTKRHTLENIGNNLNPEQFKKDSQRYSDYPFLWFAQAFHEFSNYYYNNYFNQLIFIRNNLREVFRLISKKNPLSEDNWEIYQYKIYGQVFPLLELITPNEKILLLRLNQLLKEYKLGGLHTKRIERELSKYLPNSINGYSKEKRVENFCNLIRGWWGFKFYPGAFLLNWLYIDIKTKEDFLKLLPLHKSNEALIMIRSNLFNIECEPGTQRILGYLIVPEQSLDTLIEYIIDLKEQNKIEISIISKIVDFSYNNSYKNYNNGVGWQKVNNFDRDNETFSTTKWNRYWTVLDSENPSELINSCIRHEGSYPFQTIQKLSKGIFLNQDRTKFFNNENKILWEALDNKVCDLFFQPMNIYHANYLKFALITKCKLNEIRLIVNEFPDSLILYLENGDKNAIVQLNDCLLNSINMPIQRMKRFHFSESVLTRTLFDYQNFKFKDPVFIEKKGD